MQLYIILLTLAVHFVGIRHTCQQWAKSNVTRVLFQQLCMCLHPLLTSIAHGATLQP